MVYTFGNTPVGNLAKKKPTKTTTKSKIDKFKAADKASMNKLSTSKVRPDGTVKDDKPTAAQKEQFRKQEETYLTKSPGTVGDKYYKNPEGTGTGQGGSGIPVDMGDKDSGVVTKSKAPLQKPAGIDKENTFIESVQMGDKDSSPQTIAPLKQSEILEPVMLLEEDEDIRTTSGVEIQRGVGLGIGRFVEGLESQKPEASLRFKVGYDFDPSTKLIDKLSVIYRQDF